MNPRLKAVLIALPLAADCVVNMLQGGSIRNTLSGEAWNHRTQKYWGWTHNAIDFIFGQGHCQRAAETEAKYGSIWASWLADLLGTKA